MFLAILGLSKLQENDGKLAEQFVHFSSHTGHGRISRHFTTRWGNNSLRWPWCRRWEWSLVVRHPQTCPCFHLRVWTGVVAAAVADVSPRKMWNPHCLPHWQTNRCSVLWLACKRYIIIIYITRGQTIRTVGETCASVLTAISHMTCFFIACSSAAGI